MLLDTLSADIMHSFNILPIEFTVGFLDGVKLLSSVFESFIFQNLANSTDTQIFKPFFYGVEFVDTQ